MPLSNTKQIKNAIRNVFGMTERDERVAEIQEEVNRRSKRLFSKLLSPSERAVADAIGMSYADALKNKCEKVGNDPTQIETLAESIRSSQPEGTITTGDGE